MRCLKIEFEPEPHISQLRFSLYINTE